MPAVKFCARLDLEQICLFLDRHEIVPIRKWQVVPEFKAGGGFEPETYREYFENSNSASNAEIGCKMPFPDGH
jgi:hypothetical protein